MAIVTTLAKFNLALDGVGLILQGSPDRPAYRAMNAPVYGTRFASGDRDYNDLSQWWYLIQTDWSGGMKDTTAFADDAKYYYSTNIDARTRPGSLRLEGGLTSAYDNTANDAIFDVKDVFYNETVVPVFLDGSNLRKISDGSLVASGASANINHYTSFLNYLWLFYDDSSANGGARNYDGTTESNKTTLIDSAVTGSVSRALGGIIAGDSLYIFVANGAGDDYISCVRTSVADPTVAGDFTLIFEKRVTAGSFITGFDQLGDEIIFGINNGFTTVINVLNLTSSVVTELQSFSSDHAVSDLRGLRYIRRFKDKIIITLPYSNSSSRGRIYSYDGSTLTKLIELNSNKEDIGAEAGWNLYGGGVVFGDNMCWGNLVYDGVSFFNFIKDSSDTANTEALPVGMSETNNKLYFKNSSSGKVLYSYDLAFGATSFKNGASESAFLVFSQHDKLQSIDKLLNRATIGFQPLATGQSIEIYYMDDTTPSVAIGDWTLLGTASNAVDGASVTSKDFYFPDGTANKKYWFRVNLKSTTSGTPTLTDFTLEYLPVPDYKKQWTININCADEVKRLDGRLVETTGRELRSRLNRAWLAKSALDFQDLDYAGTQLNGSLDASTATVTVDSTADFPEQGRLRVDDEEILYTGKTYTTFTGCIRGARGTRATTHADNAVINNAYSVIVIGIDEVAPILNEDNHVEYIVGLSLREV